MLFATFTAEKYREIWILTNSLPGATGQGDLYPEHGGGLWKHQGKRQQQRGVPGAASTIIESQSQK